MTDEPNDDPTIARAKAAIARVDAKRAEWEAEAFEREARQIELQSRLDCGWGLSMREADELADLLCGGEREPWQSPPKQRPEPPPKLDTQQPTSSARARPKILYRDVPTDDYDGRAPGILYRDIPSDDYDGRGDQ